MENLATFNWSGVLPEGVLAGFAVATIAFAAFSGSDRSGRWVSLFALLGMVAALVIEMYFPLEQQGEFAVDAPFGIFALSCALLSALMVFVYSAKGAGNRNELFALIMLCAASLTLFVRSDNLMFAFVALECATVCLYTMSAWSRSVPSSLEAAAKYLVVSGVSGAIFLLGIAFIYGAGVSSGRDLLLFENFSSGLSNTLFCIGLVLMVSGVLFKLAAFPFQFWAPDVYQGSPTPISAFFAVASKGAGIVFLMKVCLALDFASMGAAQLRSDAVLLVSVVSALTILVGNLGGITQINVKRLTAFSGIANAGYLLVLVAAVLKYRPDAEFLSSVLYFYLAAYLLANYGLFFVVNQFEGIDDSAQTFSDYRGLSKNSAVLESSLIVNLASLAGIPPTAGFFGKLLILIVAWYAQLYWLMAVMIFGSVVSIYYYFGWMRASLDSRSGAAEGGRKLVNTSALYPTVIVLTAASLFFGVFFFFFGVV